MCTKIWRLPWKSVWYVHEHSRENFLDILAVVINSSLISSVCGDQERERNERVCVREKENWMATKNSKLLQILSWCAHCNYVYALSLVTLSLSSESLSILRVFCRYPSRHSLYSLSLSSLSHFLFRHSLTFSFVTLSLSLSSLSHFLFRHSLSRATLSLPFSLFTLSRRSL